MSGLIAHVSAYEELAVDAALRGGRDRVAAALLAHPLVGQYDLAEQLTDRLLAENAAVPALDCPSVSGAEPLRAGTSAPAAVLAIDGGNSKTDVALVGADGAMLGVRRGGTPTTRASASSGTVRVLTELVRAAAAQAGLPADGLVAQHTSACLAGADLPVRGSRPEPAGAVARLVGHQLRA